MEVLEETLGAWVGMGRIVVGGCKEAVRRQDGTRCGWEPVRDLVKGCLGTGHGAVKVLMGSLGAERGLLLGLTLFLDFFTFFSSSFFLF